jgi:DNA-binding transcriptional LysR family regulator
MVDSKRLRQFLAVYEHGSIAAAAEVLLLTQPALSKSIKALEAELNVTLFERTPSGVKPTVFAQALARHAHRVMAELHAAQSHIAYMKGDVGGVVRIGVGPSVAASVIPGFLEAASALRRELVLHIIEGSVGELVPALRREELDFLVSVFTETVEPELTVYPLLQDMAGVVARQGHPLIQSADSTARLLDFPWILPPPHQSWRIALDGAFAERGLQPPRPAVISNSPTVILSMLKRTDMLSFLPSFIYRQESESIVAGISEAITAKLRICVIRPSRKHLAPAVSHIIDLLIDYVNANFPKRVA